MITAQTTICLLFVIATSVECRKASLKKGLLAVIRDKVTPEEISEMILSPRRRDLTAITSYDNKIETRKLRASVEKKDKRSVELKRDLHAVQMITTRLKKATSEKEASSNQEGYLSQSRLKRIVYNSQNNHKPKPLPGVFLTAVARVVVPARPESTDKTSGPESKPRLLRLHEVKRSV